MAGSSLATVKSSPSYTPTEQRAIELMVKGVPPAAIAQKLAEGDPAKAKQWRSKLRRLANSDAARLLVMEEVQGRALMGSVPAVEALIKRAKRGRVDAIKLLFELNGLHNNKVHHEHSGEVSITIKGMERPIPVETEDSVVDAEVVEE